MAYRGTGYYNDAYLRFRITMFAILSHAAANTVNSYTYGTDTRQYYQM